jgi:hypothetical protein
VSSRMQLYERAKNKVSLGGSPGGDSGLGLACVKKKKVPGQVNWRCVRKRPPPSLTVSPSPCPCEVDPKRIVAIKNAMHRKIDQSITGGPFQLRRSFRQFDRDASGMIDLENFRNTLKDYFSMDASEEEVTALFAVYDTDYNGALDYKEFCNVIIEPDFKAVSQW